MKLSPVADSLARSLKTQWNTHCYWDELRLVVDSLTASDYSTSVLDRLTDMVKRRLPQR